MKKLITGIALVCAMQFATAQSSDFKQDVMKFMQVSDMNSQQMIMLKDAVSKMGASEEKQKQIMAEIKETLPKLNEKVAGELMKIYTHDEVKQLIEFYQSPLGKKLVEKQKKSLPIMTKLGEEWGKEYLMPIIIKYMQ